MEIKSLNGISCEALFKAFGRAFAEYEVQLDDRQLEAMLRRRGFDPALSFAAFEAGEIVSFTLNGIGTFRDSPTTYDTGTGTLKQYRGKGLATDIFEYSIPHLRNAGVTQYLLEVLQHNTKAVSVYQNLGFEITREFNYFGQRNEEIDTESKQPDPRYSIRRIDRAEDYSVSKFWDFQPAWQNNFESVRRSTADFISLGVFVDDKIAGYCVFEPASGDITQLAVDKPHRRRGIAASLIKEALKHNRHSAVKAINTDVSCDSITGFMKALNIELKGTQYEMMRPV